MQISEASPLQETSFHESSPNPDPSSQRHDPRPSSSETKPSLAEDYSRTFQRLLEEKEAIIQDLFQENQRLLQDQELRRVLSPKSLGSPEYMSPKEVDYKKMLDLENKKTELEKRVKDLEKEVNYYTRSSRSPVFRENEEGGEEVERLKGENGRLSAEVASLKQTMNSVNRENLELKKKVQKLTQETLLLTRRLDQPHDSEDDSIAEISRLKAKISQLKFQEEQNIQELARLTHLNQELLENKSNYSFDVLGQSTLSSSGNRAKRELDLLKTVNNDLEKRVASLLNNENVLNHRIESLSTVNQQLMMEKDEEFIEAMKNKIMELEARIFTLSDENLELKSAQKQAESVNFQLKELKEALCLELDNSKVNIQRKNDEAIELKMEVVKLQRELEVRQKELIEANERADGNRQGVMTELNELRNVVQGLKAEKGRVSGDLRMALERKNEEIEGNMREIDELKENNKHLEERIEGYESDIIHLKAELEISQGENRQLCSELELKEQKLGFYSEEIEGHLMKIERMELKNNEQEVIIRELEDQKQEVMGVNRTEAQEKEELREMIRGLKTESLNQAERFNELINVKDCHLRFLKEKFAEDLKDFIARINKNPNVDIFKTVDAMKESGFVLTHKEASIKQLKEKIKATQMEIKELKEKNKGLQETLNKLPKNKVMMTGKIPMENTAKNQETQDSFLMINRLETQIFGLKMDLKKIQEESGFRKDLLEVSEDKVREREKEIGVLRERINILEREINEGKRNHKIEVQELISQNQTLYQEKMGFREERSRDNQEYDSLISQLQEADRALSQSKEEILRKTAMIQSLKQDLQDSQENLEKSNEKSIKLTEELEKIKKVNKETVRKDQTYRIFQDKLDQSKLAEKQWSEERSSLNEKLKALKADMQRKEAFNKELKEKLDQALTKLETNKNLQEENDKLKENLKKLRSEIDRKETSLGLLKGKLDDCLSENSMLKTSKSVTVAGDDKENKRLEFTKSSLKKSEAQTQMLLYLIKRLFREIYTHVRKLRNRSINQNTIGSGNLTNKGFDERTLSDSLNILKLSPQELNEFLQPKGKTETTNGEDERLIERFESEIMDTENINVNEVYTMLCGIIDERVKLEKKC